MFGVRNSLLQQQFGLRIKTEPVVSLAHGALEVAADRRLLGKTILNLFDTPIEDFAYRNGFTAALTWIGDRKQRDEKVRRPLRSACLDLRAVRLAAGEISGHAGRACKDDEADDCSGTQLCETQRALDGGVDQRRLWLREADTVGHQCPRLGQRLAPCQQEIATSSFPLPRPHCCRQASMRPKMFTILLAPGAHARPMLEQGLVRNGDHGLTAVVEVADKKPRLEQCLEQFPRRRTCECRERRNKTHHRVVFDVQTHEFPQDQRQCAACLRADRLEHFFRALRQGTRDATQLLIGAECEHIVVAAALVQLL